MDTSTPRFRKDLTVEAREEDGVTVAYVTDPKTGNSFTFYEFEFELANQFNGQTTDEIIAWAVGNFETALTPDAVDEFARKLDELGFLEKGGASGVPTGDNLEAESGPARTEIMKDIPPELLMEARRDNLDTVDDLPPDALTEMPDSGPNAAPVPAPAGGGVPERLSGGPASSFSARIANVATSTGRYPKAAIERRQPPSPDAVVMTQFEDVSARFRAPPPERPRSSTGLFIGIAVLIVVGGGGGYYFWMRAHPKVPQAIRLRVVAPQPTAVYRWFASIGTVVDLEARAMAFEAPGKVVELMPAGTKFAVGDTLGKLQDAAALEAELAKEKSKLAFYEQLRDGMKASGNEAKRKDAEEKVAARKKVVDETQANLAKLVLKAPESGVIVDTPVKVGTTVAAKVPALKWRGRSLHGDFTMDQEDFAKASKLEFCRVEVVGLGATGSPSSAPGAAPTTAPAQAAAAGADAAASADAGAPKSTSEVRYVDCTMPPPAPPPAGGVPNLLRKFIVTLPTDAGLVTGQQLHLARKRYDAVFPIPVSAVLDQVDTQGRIWIALPNGTAETRMVTIAEARDEVLVSRGLNVGDEVIVEPPQELTQGAKVEPIR